MAKAGAQYDVVTGNIWSYAHRGDLTGVKAALARGVDVNLQNTVGWTAVHAAAAGGHTRTIRALVRAGADIHLQDRGGNRPVHEAARCGQTNALKALEALGADLAAVRLSQTKGQAARALVARATRRVAAANGRAGAEGGAEEGADMVPAVGYRRAQVRSNAFYGPRKTPISGKIKREILQRRRREKKAALEAQQQPSGDTVAVQARGPDAQAGVLVEEALGPCEAAAEGEADYPSPGDEGPTRADASPSYGETVKAVQQQRRQDRKARADRRARGKGRAGAEEQAGRWVFRDAALDTAAEEEQAPQRTARAATGGSFAALLLDDDA